MKNKGKVHKYCIGLVQSSRGQIRACKYEWASHGNVSEKNHENKIPFNSPRSTTK